MNENNKMIMVLPGTVWQIELIKKIKSLGYKVAVVHPYKDAPAFKYADEIVYEDILDQEAVLAAAKRLKVCAVMSDECDIATPTLAYVSSELGLPSQGIDMARLYTDKSCMRDLCYKHGLPCPSYKVCQNIDEALSFYRSLNRKMIIKPIDANSSRGVFTVESEQQLHEKFNDSIKYSHHKKAVICERYISGAEFSVDGIMTPYGHFCLAISEKQQFSYNKNLDKYLFFSYDNEKYDYDYLREIDTKYVEMSGLPFGFTHAEYRYEDGEFYLLEIGARGGGNLISSHIVPAMTGLDNYSLLIDMFVGNEVKVDFCQEDFRTDKVAVLNFFDTTEQGGVVKSVSGLDYLSQSENVLFYQMNFKIGDKIQRPTDGGNRIGFYIACCDSRFELEKLQNEIDSKFVIEYE